MDWPLDPPQTDAVECVQRVEAKRRVRQTWCCRQEENVWWAFGLMWFCCAS